MSRPRPGLSSLAALAMMIAPEASRAEERVVSDPRELARAVREARPGDLILIADGVWRDADLVLEARGTPDRPVTVRARTPGKVVLSGRSRLQFSGTGLVIDGLWFQDGTPAGSDVVAFRSSSTRLADHCRLTNCAITDFNTPRKESDTKWVSLHGRNNRVDHCYLSGKTNEGTTLVDWVGDGPSEHLIDHNHFGPRPPLGVNGGETIRVGDSSHAATSARTVVASNLFEACNGEVEVISSKSCENVYRHNVFLGCEGALTLRHGDRCTVEGNVFLGKGKKMTGGVRVIGEDHRVVNNYFEGLTGTGVRSALTLMNGIPDSEPNGYFQVKRAVIAFNTFVDCRSTFVIGYSGNGARRPTLPPVGGTIANNVVLRGDGPMVRFETASPDLAWRGNLVFGVATGLPPEDELRAIDPKLERSADGLLRPVVDSPVVGASVGDFPTVVDDLDGRPRGPRKDVGCHQWSPVPAREALPNRGEVGPSWR
jgi:poly(beta-D-mannuronate) lyase